MAHHPYQLPRPPPGTWLGAPVDPHHVAHGAFLSHLNYATWEFCCDEGVINAHEYLITSPASWFGGASMATWLLQGGSSCHRPGQTAADRSRFLTEGKRHRRHSNMAADDSRQNLHGPSPRSPLD